jgi:dephospho-CoA kinase
VAELLGLQAGQLSRELIASLVFNDPGKLAQLEAILHPAVFDEIENTYNQIDHHLYPLFIAEIPLLYETNQEGRFDTIVAVLADEPLCKQRFSKTEYSARMRRQLPPSLKAAKAHYVLINNGSIDELKTQVQSLYFQLTQ